MIPKKWIYDPADTSWKFGTPNNGGGVFQEGNHWEGNVVTPQGSTIFGFGPFETKEKAMLEIEKRYEIQIEIDSQ